MHSLSTRLVVLGAFLSTACAGPVPRQSFLDPGQWSMRVAQSVWSDDEVDSSAAVDPEEIRSTEFQYEYAFAEGFGLVGGLGSRSYRFDAIDDISTTEFSLGVRSYTMPFHERVLGYFALGLRYGDLPGSDQSYDLDTGLGVVFPFDGFHVDLNLTRGIALTGGDVPFLQNFERNHTIVSLGVGWTFGSGE